MGERLFVRLDDDPLYAPETTVPAGTLSELAVPAALGAHVAHVMAYEETVPPGVVVSERVLPDGALRLVFDLHAGAASVVGPSASPVLLALRGPMRGLSVTLRPGAALAVFGVAAHELAERVLPWDAVAAPAHRSLPERLMAARGGAEPAALLLQALREMRRDDADEPPVRRARAAAALLRAASGAGPAVREVAQALGVGERRLQQIFRSEVGLSPRTWARLGRLHDCLRRLRQPAPLPWSLLAADAGFYDQSHLIHEFQALCGLTPEQFVRRVSGSSKTPG